MADNVAFTTKEVLTSQEAARYMGISLSHLDKLTMRQEIPHYKPMGKLCYFNRHELEEWLQTNRINTGAEAQKSRMRIDCTASTRSYGPLENMRNRAGILCLYIGDNTHTRPGQERRSDLALSKTAHISSIYTPDIGLPFWYGDFHKTADAALFVCSGVRFVDGAIQPGSVVEVLVARGQRSHRQGLYNMLCDGELSDEVEELRKRAVNESVTGNGNV